MMGYGLFVTAPNPCSEVIRSTYAWCREALWTSGLIDTTMLPNNILLILDSHYEPSSVHRLCAAVRESLVCTKKKKKSEPPSHLSYLCKILYETFLGSGDLKIGQCSKFSGKRHTPSPTAPFPTYALLFHICLEVSKMYFSIYFYISEIAQHVHWGCWAIVLPSIISRSTGSSVDAFYVFIWKSQCEFTKLPLCRTFI